MGQNIQEYIKSQRNSGISDEDIKISLRQVGWSDGSILSAFSPDIPPPPQAETPLQVDPTAQVGMWVSFQYILLFIAMYVSATSLGGIIKIAIDKFFPDTLLGAYSMGFHYISTYLIRGYIAGIIVTYPVFLLLFMMISRQIDKNPSIRELKSRKILVYLTMIGTFLMMVSHLIITFMYFLAGKATLNSMLDLGLTLVISGGIFVYFLLAVRRERSAI